MPECSVPCPSFEEAGLEVTGVCDCQDYNTPGNPDCVIHGPEVRAWIQGYRGALDVLKATHAQMLKALPYYGAAK